VQVHRATPDFEALGTRVVVIGNGLPRFVADFRRTTEFDGELFTDPSRDAYRACGFVRGIGSTFNGRALRAGLRAFSNGYRQGRTKGDPWQQGGALLVAPPNQVIAYQRSAHAGDHAKLSTLVTALGEHLAQESRG